MRKVKILTFFCAIFLLFFTSSPRIIADAAYTPPFDIMSEGAYMVNLDKDVVVYEKNADKQIYPTDTTDIMTLLVALENVKNFKETVDVPYAVTNEFNGENPNYTHVTNAGILTKQENLTYWDCMHALMLRSACEAANIIAYNVGGGSIEKFVEMMNETAEKIGCKNTRFVNAHGCYAENLYTTAHDLYLITRYAIDNYPGFIDICNTSTYIMPPNSDNPATVEEGGRQGYRITNDIDMINPKSPDYYKGLYAIKAGAVARLYPKKDGKWSWQDYIQGSQAMVTMAERDGYRYLLVTLGAPFYDEYGNKPEKIYGYSYDDHSKLYDWVFKGFEYRQIVVKNQLFKQLKVEKGENVNTVNIVPIEDFSTLIPTMLDDSAIQLVADPISLETATLTAPLEAGTLVGNMIIRLNGEQVGSIPLAIEKDVKLDAVANYQDRLKNIFSSPIVIVLIVLIAALIIAIAALRIVVNNKKKRQAELMRRRKIQMAPRSKNNNIRRR